MYIVITYLNTQYSDTQCLEITKQASRKLFNIWIFTLKMPVFTGISVENEDFWGYFE